MAQERSAEHAVDIAKAIARAFAREDTSPSVGLFAVAGDESRLGVQVQSGAHAVWVLGSHDAFDAAEPVAVETTFRRAPAIGVAGDVVYDLPSAPGTIQRLEPGAYVVPTVCLWNCP